MSDKLKQKNTRAEPTKQTVVEQDKPKMKPNPWAGFHGGFGGAPVLEPDFIEDKTVVADDMPERREMRNPNSPKNTWYQNGYDVGWNACIDHIEKANRGKRKPCPPADAKCADCNSDMILVCSGLELNANGKDAGKCPTGTDRQPVGSLFKDKVILSADVLKQVADALGAASRIVVPEFYEHSGPKIQQAIALLQPYLGKGE